MASLFQSHFGIPVYDSDSTAKRIMAESEEVRGTLELLLGQPVCHADGTLDRKLLAQYVFGDPKSARDVESVVHPAVKSDFLTWAMEFEKQSPATRAVIIESAILIEAGFTDAVDTVVTVEAPMDLRIARVMKRDGLSEQQVRKRIACQISEAERRKLANAVITNDGRNLLEQLESILSELKTERYNY
ncbi:MAG: dephospho-CoA kinase [Bacteroidaceae bacterium]|nr:dephospho-CoA kinase [Bacteroidaceae bacterium]